MESYHAHQRILPTDKRNPSFSLYASEDGQFIRVFYGLELMEEVPDDPDDMADKMLVGRLYKAGVLVARLEEVFKADRKTIRSWGLAIPSRDPEHLARVLLGRGVNRKRTPAIDHYVARRWPELTGEGCPNYRATLIREIEGIFEVRLQWSPGRVLTLIVDRGIYSNDIFNRVLADPAIHLITWEKGYQSQTDTPWETLVAGHRPAGTRGAHTFSRRRNNSRDHRPYHFEYIHRPWARNPGIRQIIVRPANSSPPTAPGAARPSASNASRPSKPTAPRAPP